LSKLLECRDRQVSELTAAQEIAKQEAERHSALVMTLRQHVADCESRRSELETAASQAEYQLSSIQQENKDAQHHILQLQAQIRSQHGRHWIFELLVYFVATER